jgi:hypothetical protein
MAKRGTDGAGLFLPLFSYYKRPIDLCCFDSYLAGAKLSADGKEKTYPGSPETRTQPQDR